MVAAFTRQTGIKVRVVSDDESPADVFYTENSNWLQQLAGQGLLAKVDANTLANVPAADSAADGDWVPQYKGDFEIAPSETDFWPLIASVARAKGDAAALAWLKALKANASEDNVPDNETLTSDVSQGIPDFAVINHYYYYRQKAADGVGDAKLAYCAPRDPGYVASVSGAARHRARGRAPRRALRLAGRRAARVRPGRRRANTRRRRRHRRPRHARPG